jgi:hypothetical protein
MGEKLALYDKTLLKGESLISFPIGFILFKYIMFSL